MQHSAKPVAQTGALPNLLLHPKQIGSHQVL